MIRSFLLFALIPFMLAACAKSDSQQTQDRVDDGNTKIERLNEISRSAAATYAVVLISNEYVSASGVDHLNERGVRSLSHADLLQVQTLTAEFIALADQVLSIIDSDGVTGGDRPKIARARENAQKIYDRVTSRLSSTDADSSTDTNTSTGT